MSNTKYGKIKLREKIKGRIMNYLEKYGVKNYLKRALPGIIILLFILIDIQNEYSKNILVGIYLFFPLIFIIQGLIVNNKRDLYWGIGLSAYSIIFGISLFYNMGTAIIPTIIYVVLGILAFRFKNHFKLLRKSI
ncbi:hypothetical protein HMPREF1092_02142 [Clostridium thermobutyricum]|uniref:Uncharacterized protein n=2 Tax=Clostridium thermobutyricum TaxID=29372 RepID=N9XZD9_9CLOT|nr:hypothetical protein HMPREF1092_02142 [Clostridium thermobutyricum]